MKNTYIFIFLSILFSVGIATVISISYTQAQVSSTNDARIGEYYATEVAVSVSPHGLRKQMDKGSDNFILVDLRSQEEYEREHIIGAVNIPAYADPETSAYGDVDRIVTSFQTLREENPNKTIIVYCYSIPCMTGNKIGNMLAEHDVYVKKLGVGWNEWRYFWELWNHEHEWDETDVLDYVHQGADPGVPHVKDTAGGCSIDNEFSC